MKNKRHMLLLMLSIFAFLLCAFLYANFAYILNTKEYKLKVNENDRKYLLHIPKNKLNQNKAIIVLHGYGDNPKLIELYSRWSTKADKEGFIVAYPQGSNWEHNKRLSWNTSFCCGGAFHTNSEDIAFISKLIEELKSKYNVKEVFVTGFSNGAMMTNRIAAEIPEKVDGIAIVAGSIGGKLEESKEYKDLKPLAPIKKVLIIHGDKDLRVPYNGGTTSTNDAEFTGVKDSVNAWTKISDCEEEPIVIDTKMYKKEEYKGCTSEIVFYTIKGLDHVWPGGLQDILVNPLSKHFYATDEIWKFFNN